jgi:hypothetical protein
MEIFLSRANGACKKVLLLLDVRDNEGLAVFYDPLRSPSGGRARGPKKLRIYARDPHDLQHLVRS